jgi:hypothetical protein
LVAAGDISAQQCDWKRPLLAELSFDLDGNIGPAAHHSTSPEGSWQFVKEGGDKPGWVTQAAFSAHTLEVPLNTSHLLEWASGKSKQERMDRLDKRDIVIILSYLKSYEKMLTVSLELCGQVIATESALWSDRFSLSYTSVLPVGHFMEKHCDQDIHRLRGQPLSQPQQQSPSPVLTLKIHSPALHLGGSHEEPAGQGAGGKFKLLGLTVCETDTGGTPFFSAQSLILD